MIRLRRLAAPALVLATLLAPSACEEAGGGAPPAAGSGGSGGSGGPGRPAAGSAGTGVPAAGSGGSGTPAAGSAGTGTPAAGSGGSGNGSAGAGPDHFASGAELRVPVGSTGRSFVRLDQLSVIAPAGSPATSTDWDLAFEGYDVFTNGGASGVAHGSAFGPFDAKDFALPVAPQFPFFLDDKTGGAFLSWYKYDGAGGHVLWPRFHVYGIKDGENYWKVQITSYYNIRDHSPTAALYGVRYASLGPDGPGTTQEVIVDGTSPATAPNECLDLGTGHKVKLTPDEALASTAWHLCFRRDNVSVNGELGGPRGTLAADFDAAATEDETLEQIKAIQPAEGLARFDAVGFDHFATATLRGDRVVSAFDGAWADFAASPPAPTPASWIVRDAHGESIYFVGFAAFEAATSASPGTVVLRVKHLGP